MESSRKFTVFVSENVLCGGWRIQAILLHRLQFAWRIYSRIIIGLIATEIRSSDDIEAFYL